jgi:hypothetical protein
MNAASAYGAHRPAGEADELIMRHAELVKRIAYHLAGRLPASVEVDDLIQAGMPLRTMPPIGGQASRHTPAYGYAAR